MSTRVRGFRSREGFAMFMALGALVIIGVLVAGSSFITLQEMRLGQNQLVQTRAFSAAEYGLNRIQQDWDLTPNLTMDNGARYPETDYAKYALNARDTAYVHYVRLNDETFWVVSEGRAFVGRTASQSRTAVKRVGAVLRLRIPSVKADAAITTAGDINVGGSSAIHGENAVPEGWADCDAAEDKPAIVAAPDADVDINNASNVTSSAGDGDLAVARDDVAGDSETYVTYGDETWDNLVEQASVELDDGATAWNDAPSGITPSLTGTACNKSDANNWGEPWRAGFDGHDASDVVDECETYFPIIYSDTSLILNHGRGQGILIVNGDFKVNGNFEWFGLIIVRARILKGNGTAEIHGGVMAAHFNLPDESEDNILGNITFNYSHCSIERALRGSAQVTQAKERAWTELY